MDDALEKMTKLANDLCDQLERVEAENKSLKEQLEAQTKTASAAPAETPVASAEAVQATCEALVKAGRLEADQVDLCKEAFLKDPDAAHRTIVQLLTAPAQEKAASVEEDVSGGTLVNGSATAAPEDKYAEMFRILGRY